MRRLARYALNALALLSLLLCVATVALWVRSYWHQDWVQHVNEHADRVWEVTVGRGEALVGH